ncbi:MAG: ATP-dependent zinc metalloprotease FtsH [Oscillospiraceae bacterium]|nr:ATP-dependent zinc metalloprotease FtsH [Oscillospiraceae bacterium]
MNQNFNNNRIRQLGFYCLMLVLLLASVYTMLNTGSTEGKLEYSEVLSLFREEKVESFSLDMDSGELVMKLREKDADGRDLYAVEIANFSAFYNDLNGEIQRQLEEGILTRYDYIPAEEPSIWLSFLPYAFMLLIFGGFWFSMMKRAQGGDMGGVARFSKARTRLGSEEKTRKTFADVAGADEEKEELMEVVDFLRNPQAYTDMGAHIPRGVLLVGPPGTGKTLLAKAVAGEANVEFLTISGSDFVELYVGVGASRVRDLFDQAKKVAPAIVFIDEIDAVGRQRGSGLGGGHDEREQTLNQLLVEMDGFNDNDGVIVMAATNRADILDNALLRPGRFDRQIYVGAPDVKGREEILKVHARNKMLGDDVDLKSIARGTIGFTGADLENLLNEAALLAVRRRQRFIRQEDMEEAILKVEMGPEKRSRVVSEKARKLTAYHEAGHAVVGYYLKHVDPVHYITIIPRGGAGGFTLFRPEEDQSYQTRQGMFESIVMALGGRVSEKLFLDDISTGAQGDIQQASDTARKMVTVYGMSERLGPISFDSSEHSIFIGRDFGQTKSYSEETAGIIDEEVRKIFDQALTRAESILREHSDVLVALAEYLLVNETMTGEDFAYFCEHKCLPPLPEKSPEVQKAEAELLSGGEAGAEETAETPEEGSEAPAEENEDAPEAE